MNKISNVVFLFFISILANICFYGCKDWQYDVVKKGIHFEKMHQSKTGNSIVCYMTEDNIIQGFPCEKDWIHFKKNWRLLSFQLSKDYNYKNTLLPAHTWSMSLT